MTYDVVIVGAGFAGLTLAYQLTKDVPHIQIALVHDGAFPNEDVTYKVGEATNEVGAIYLSQILGLNQFMKDRYPRKMGMRFFMTDENSYRELGVNGFPSNDSFHFERGKLENDLYELVKEKVSIFQRHKFIESHSTDQDKQIRIQDLANNQEIHLKARWFVDAAGLKKIFARKEDLTKRLPLNHSSVWFRLAGAVNVDEIFPREAGNPFDSPYRSWSSTHVEGDGYWIWILRLSETVTSVGIIFDEDAIAFSDLANWEKVRTWLYQHETQLIDYIEAKQFEQIDFRLLRRFATQNSHWVSEECWATIGDAYGLWDPYYSSGFDIIGIQNTALTALIRAERMGEVICERVKRANLYLELFMQGSGMMFYDSYHRKSRWYYLCVKYPIDVALYFGFVCANMHNALPYMFLKEDDVFADEAIMFLEQAGLVYEDMIKYMKSDEFTNNGYEGDKYLKLTEKSYDLFNPVKNISYDERDDLLKILNKNFIILKCFHNYLVSGRDFLNFIKGRAYFSVTEKTDPDVYLDNPDQLEKDLFQ